MKKEKTVPDHQGGAKYQRDTSGGTDHSLETWTENTVLPASFVHENLDSGAPHHYDVVTMQSSEARCSLVVNGSAQHEGWAPEAPCSEVKAPEASLGKLLASEAMPYHSKGRADRDTHKVLDQTILLGQDFFDFMV